MTELTSLTPMRLNAMQHEAVEVTDRHVLVLAGAGSGKTRVITAKIFHLIKVLKVDPYAILAVTFTNKAAGEMRERIGQLLANLGHSDRSNAPSHSDRTDHTEHAGHSVQAPNNAEYSGNSANLDETEQTWSSGPSMDLGYGGYPERSGRSYKASILTFHAFGVKFLRMFLHLLPERQNSFVICDEAQKKVFLREIFKEHGFNTQELKEASRFISLVKNKLIFSDAPDFESKIEAFFTFKLKAKQKAFVTVYRAYEKLLLESNRIDFDDLIVLPLRLLYEQASARAYIGRRWKYLLVDEYQDTDSVQEKIIEQFSKQGSLITAVGDDNQSIYGFRGAQISNILQFSSRYPNVHCVLLEQNYRSTNAILDFANAVIANNPKQVAKKLYAQQDFHGHKPRYLGFKSDLEEAMWLTQNIVHLKNEGTKLSEIAVFYRTNYQSRIIEEHLVKAKLPYRVVKGFRFYERKEIKEVLAYLNFIVNLRDRPAFKACINVPKRAIGEQTLKTIFEFIDIHAAATGTPRDHSSENSLEKDNLATNDLDKAKETKGHTAKGDVVEGHTAKGDVVEGYTEKDREMRNILEAIENPALSEKLPKRVHQPLSDFIALIRQCMKMLAENKPLNELIEHVIRKSGIWKHYDQLPDKFERDQRLGSLKQLIYSGIDFSEQSEALQDAQFPESPEFAQSSQLSQSPEPLQSARFSEISQSPEPPQSAQFSETSQSPGPPQSARFSETSQSPGPPQSARFSETSQSPESLQSARFSETSQSPEPPQSAQFFQSPQENLLVAFLENISLAGSEEPETQTEVINLLTVHNAKGLEYHTVYVVGMEEGVFPHFLSMGEPSQLEEERRLFYVAVTRAMHRLHLSSAEIKQVRGEFDFFKASRFLKEIPESYFAAESTLLKDEN